MILLTEQKNIRKVFRHLNCNIKIAERVRIYEEIGQGAKFFSQRAKKTF